MTPWTAAHQASLFIIMSQSLLKLMAIVSMMPSNHILLCCPFSCPQSFPASELFPVSPSNEYLGLISLRIDWFDLLAVQGTLKSLLQKTTVGRHQFFGTQPSLWSNSHIPYMTTGKTIALTRQTFVGKVMSLLFNMLSGFFIAFLPKNKCLLIS